MIRVSVGIDEDDRQVRKIFHDLPGILRRHAGIDQRGLFRTAKEEKANSSVFDTPCGLIDLDCICHCLFLLIRCLYADIFTVSFSDPAGFLCS